MLENKYKQITISEYVSLYDKIISKDNFLRKLKEICLEKNRTKRYTIKLLSIAHKEQYDFE